MSAFPWNLKSQWHRTVISRRQGPDYPTPDKIFFAQVFFGIGLAFTRSLLILDADLLCRPYALTLFIGFRQFFSARLSVRTNFYADKNVETVPHKVFVPACSQLVLSPIGTSICTAKRTSICTAKRTSICTHFI